MAATEVVRARIDPKTKQRAAAVLSKMGLSVSDAIRLLLVRVASEKSLPFEVSTPNQRTRDAIRAAERGELVSHGSVHELLSELNDDKA